MAAFYEDWDEEFLESAIQAEAAISSSAFSSITQLPPKLVPPRPAPLYASHISYSPPRELSQRVKEESHRNFSDKGFDCPVSLNGTNRGLSSAPPFPPRELSQRVKEDNDRKFPDKSFDCPVSLNGISRGPSSAFPFPHRELSHRAKEEDNHSNLPNKGFERPVSLNGINRGLNSAPPLPQRELSERAKEEDNYRNFPDKGKGFDRPVSVNGINRGLNSAPPLPHRELSKRAKEEDNHRNFPDKGFDLPASLNGINRGLAPPLPLSSRFHDEDNHSKQLEIKPPLPLSFRFHDEDNHSKQLEINRLKEELGRVSKDLTNLEKECSELKKDREKNEKLLKAVVPVNGSKDAESLIMKTKNHDEDSSIILSGTKGVVPCKAVGVQTDEHMALDEPTLKNTSSVTYHSRKLASIWEPGNGQQPRNNFVSKLFVSCGADLQVMFGCLGLNIPYRSRTTKMDSFKPDQNCIQSVEAEKVSHLYFTLTKIGYDTGRLDDLFKALIDLCHVENKMIVYRSLCVLHVVLRHSLSMEDKGCSRDKNVIFNNDPSTSDNPPCHPLLTRLINPKKVDDSSSCLKWFSFYQTMHQIITRHTEENIRLEAVSIMNILLLRTDAYTERQMYGEVAVFETISQLLKKESGVNVQNQTVDLLYLLLNCPNLMMMFCSTCKEEGTSAQNTETTPVFKGLGAILDGLADCLACCGNSATTTLVLKLQRNAIILLAFLASSGRSGFGMLLGHNPSRRTNFLYLILQILASEIDVETSESTHLYDDFKERRLVIREALILLNRLVSSSEYSTTVLRVLTNRRNMACLTIDIATRLSKKDTMMMRDNTEIVDLARIFKKRVFTFLGDTK